MIQPSPIETKCQHDGEWIVTDGWHTGRGWSEADAILDWWRQEKEKLGRAKRAYPRPARYTEPVD